MKFKILFCIIFIFSFSLFSQSDSHSNLDNFIQVGADVLTAPNDFNKHDWENLTFTLSSTALSFIIDDNIQNFSQQNKTNLLNHFFKIDKYFIPFGLTITAGLFGYDLINKDREVKNLAMRLSESIFYSLMINYSLKFLIGRARPYANKEEFNFEPFSISEAQTSLPSGHSTFAFAFGNTMAKEYNNFFWKFGWYSIAALVSYARVYNNVHWFSDIIFGGAIGYFTSEFVNNHKANNKQLNIQQTDIYKINFTIPIK